MLTNMTKLDVDETLELLMEASGPSFRNHVQDWGAVHADPRRSALMTHLFVAAS